MAPKQKEVYDFMKKFHTKNSYPPSLRDMEAHFKVSYQSIQDILKRLIEKGFVTNPKRGIYLTVDK